MIGQIQQSIVLLHFIGIFKYNSSITGSDILLGVIPISICLLKNYLAILIDAPVDRQVR